MTKKEFKRAMQCGLGRCIWELQSCEDIEKYREIVLWGCTHNLAYDAQSEGTRGDYLYQLVTYYPDETPFVEAVIVSLKKSAAKSDWDFLQFCRFLELCAREGNQTATHALYNQYQHTYDMLKNTCSEKNRTGTPSKTILPVLERFPIRTWDITETCVPGIGIHERRCNPQLCIKLTAKGRTFGKCNLYAGKQLP